MKLHFNKYEGTGIATQVAKPVCKSSGREAARRFNAIADVYEILGNPVTRVLYDTGGMAAVRMGQEGQLQEGENIVHELEVKLQEFYRGKTQIIQVKRRVVCRRCRKTRDPKRCQGCSPCPARKYHVQRTQGARVFNEERSEPSMEDCRWEETPLEVHVERGSAPGDTVEFKHMASQTPKQIPGHVIVTLKEKKPTKYSGWVRNGADLEHPVRLTLLESLAGFQRSFKHFDGHMVEFSTESVTKYGQIFEIEGEGMPVKGEPGQFGNLRLVAEVQHPTFFSRQDREELLAVKALQKQKLHKPVEKPAPKAKDEL